MRPCSGKSLLFRFDHFRRIEHEGWLPPLPLIPAKTGTQFIGLGR